jgi:hypothetical protein
MCVRKTNQTKGTAHLWLNTTVLRVKNTHLVRLKRVLLETRKTDQLKQGLGYNGHSDLCWRQCPGFVYWLTVPALAGIKDNHQRQPRQAYLDCAEIAGRKLICSSDGECLIVDLYEGARGFDVIRPPELVPKVE